MEHDDPHIEEILAKMQKLLAESRQLRERHDQLTEEYLNLKREFKERTARTRTAVIWGFFTTCGAALYFGPLFVRTVDFRHQR